MTVLAHVADVAGYGWQPWTGAAAAVSPSPSTSCASPTADSRVDVDPTDGTFSVDGHAGMGRLVDGGDVGDTYNWCPPLTETMIDTPVTVSTRIVESGPVRGRLEVTRTSELPTHVEDRHGSGPVSGGANHPRAARR